MDLKLASGALTARVPIRASAITLLAEIDSTIPAKWHYRERVRKMATPGVAHAVTNTNGMAWEPARSTVWHGHYMVMHFETTCANPISLTVCIVAHELSAIIIETCARLCHAVVSLIVFADFFDALGCTAFAYPSVAFAEGTPRSVAQLSRVRVRVLWADNSTSTACLRQIALVHSCTANFVRLGRDEQTIFATRTRLHGALKVRLFELAFCSVTTWVHIGAIVGPAIASLTLFYEAVATDWIAENPIWSIFQALAAVWVCVLEELRDIGGAARRELCGCYITTNSFHD